MEKAKITIRTLSIGGDIAGAHPGNAAHAAIRNSLPKDVVSDIELKVKAAVIDDQIFVSTMPMFDKSLTVEWKRFQKTVTRRPRSNSRIEPMRSKSADNVLSFDPPTSAESSDAYDYIARKMFNAVFGVRLQQRKMMWRTVNFSFSGSEGIDWIMRNVYVASDRTKAAEFGNFIMQHGGGTFEQIGSAAKRIGILKDDSTLYKPLKIYQDQVVEVSQDEFAKQLQLSSDDDATTDHAEEAAAAAEAELRRSNSVDQIGSSSPLDGSVASPDHSNATTPRSAGSSRAGSRTASAKNLRGNSIQSGYISQGEGVVTVEISIDDAEKRAKRRRAASVSHIIRPASNSSDFDKKKPYELMEELVLDPDMTLLLVLSDIEMSKRDVGHFARAVVYLHCNRGVDMLPVLNVLLADEVNTHVESMLLFRSNNFNTYALSAFAKQVGQPWLRKIFAPVLEALHTHDEIQFDEDGYLIPSCDRPFCSLLEEVIDRISSSVSDCPPQIRLLCRNIRELLPAKNKQEAFFHIASFLFLRVICPALLVPDEYGLLASPLNHHRQRILVQLSKTIQSYCGQKADAQSPRKPERRTAKRGDATTDSSTGSDVEPAPVVTELPLLHSVAVPNKMALEAFVLRLVVRKPRTNYSETQKQISLLRLRFQAVGHMKKVKPFKLEHPAKEVHLRALQAVHTLVAEKSAEIIARVSSKYSERLSDISFVIEQIASEPLPELKRAASQTATKSRSKSQLNSNNVLRL